jgi:hypothetical protein
MDNGAQNMLAECRLSTWSGPRNGRNRLVEGVNAAVGLVCGSCAEKESESG